MTTFRLTATGSARSLATRDDDSSDRLRSCCHSTPACVRRATVRQGVRRNIPANKRRLGDGSRLAGYGRSRTASQALSKGREVAIFIINVGIQQLYCTVSMFFYLFARGLILFHT